MFVELFIFPLNCKHLRKYAAIEVFERSPFYFLNAYDSLKYYLTLSCMLYRTNKNVLIEIGAPVSAWERAKHVCEKWFEILLVLASLCYEKKSEQNFETCQKYKETLRSSVRFMFDCCFHEVIFNSLNVF